MIPEGFCGAGDDSNGKSRGGTRGGRDVGQNVHVEWSGKFIVLERYVLVLGFLCRRLALTMTYP